MASSSAVAAAAASQASASAKPAAPALVRAKTAVRLASKLPKSAAKKRIIIDPGHGGTDPGTQSLIKINGKRVLEKDLDLKIALELNRLLKTLPNVTPVLTRDTDIHVSKIDRVNFAERLGGNLFVCIHANSTKYHSKHPSLRGMTIYYLGADTDLAVKEKEAEEDQHGKIPGQPTATPLVLKIAAAKNNPEAWRPLAAEACESIRKSFARDFYYGLFQVRVREASYKVLSNRVMPSVLIEVGYMDVSREMKHLAASAFQKHIASLIANGILRYLAKQDPQFAYTPFKPK